MLEQRPFATVISEPSSFQQAFERLLARAPGPVFPRARALYLQKYPLEGEPQGDFRTFLLEEDIQESPVGALRIRALAMAIVAWGQPRFDVAGAATYLQQRWGLRPHDLQEVEGASWFRNSGAYGRFSGLAVYERVAPTSLINSSADPGPPAADPGSGA
jgi:hypothetical protein